MAGGLDPVAVTIEKHMALLPSPVLIMLSSGDILDLRADRDCIAT